MLRGARLASMRLRWRRQRRWSIILSTTWAIARPMLMHSLPVPQIPTMKMYFHASILDYVLFKVLL